MVSGSTNPAGLMTKYSSGERIKMLLNRMVMTEYSGRHHLEAQLQEDSDNATSLMVWVWSTAKDLTSCQIIDYRA